MKTPITASYLISKGFTISQQCGHSDNTFFLNIKDFDMEEDAWAELYVEYGNGTDLNCWNVFYKRTYRVTFGKRIATTPLFSGLYYEEELDKILDIFTNWDKIAESHYESDLN